MDLHGIAEESIVRIEPDRFMSSEQFFEFCQANSSWRIERAADGEIVIMPPAGLDSGYNCLEVSGQLRDWARRDGRGLASESSSGFELPNGATRPPDAAWIENHRLATLTREQKRRFSPLVPDFLIEVQSPSDSLPRTKREMREWIDNGVKLAWLIVPDSRTVYIYRPGAEPDTAINIFQIQGESPVDGFTLDLTTIWADWAEF